MLYHSNPIYFILNQSFYDILILCHGNPIYFILILNSFDPDSFQSNLYHSDPQFFELTLHISVYISFFFFSHLISDLTFFVRFFYFIPILSVPFLFDFFLSILILFSSILSTCISIDLIQINFDPLYFKVFLSISL